MRVSDVTNFFGFTEIKPKPVHDEPKVEQEPEAPKKVLYSWKALSRPPRKRLGSKTSRNFIMIGVVICLLLLAMQLFWLILVIVSIIFVSYVLVQAPPEELEYEITTNGLSYGDRFYYWNEFKHFFFLERTDIKVIGIDLYDGLPTRVYLTIQEGDEEKVKNLLETYVHFLEQEQKSYMDKSYDWLVGKLEFEEDQE